DKQGILHCYFFQGEDGIRGGHVTGVQTCALPISLWSSEVRGTSEGGPTEPSLAQALARVHASAVRTRPRWSMRSNIPWVAAAGPLWVSVAPPLSLEQQPRDAAPGVHADTGADHAGDERR